jgi:hypothetical protein
MSKYKAEVQWRLNDLGEENRQRWTRVHRVSFHAEDLTRCHIVIPEHPYMMNRDEWIPTDAPRCKRCAAVDE